MKARLLELLHRHELGHITSNLGTLAILESIFSDDKFTNNDLVILSAGHAGLSLYVALEKYRGQDAELLLNDLGAQPHLDPSRGIYCSSGSLGQGLTVAVGYALADRQRQVHCIISDGECAEGCVWESLSFIHQQQLRNLKVHVNINGMSALGAVNVPYLTRRLMVFLPTIKLHFTEKETLPFLHGIHGHYKVMTDAEYESTL
jgi:transketolase